MTSPTDDLLMPPADPMPLAPTDPEPEAEQPPQVKIEPPKEFDPKWRLPFTGLAFLGHLVHEFEVWGHSFRIMTPSHLEKMNIGLVHAPYVGTLSTEIAFEAAMVAAYLHSIDGVELPKPVVNDTKETAFRDRFNWVTENLKRPVILKVYNECLILDEEVEKVLDAMGEA
jgi:hypothetical protein